VVQRLWAHGDHVDLGERTVGPTGAAPPRQGAAKASSSASAGAGDRAAELVVVAADEAMGGDYRCRRWPRQPALGVAERLVDEVELPGGRWPPPAAPVVRRFAEAFAGQPQRLEGRPRRM
jgi:hypothetical protein